jgi:hypothetical protein
MSYELLPHARSAQPLAVVSVLFAQTLRST